MQKAEVTFLGAAGTVTGSRFLVSYRGTRILIDCGMFQGLKELRLMNWEPLSVPASNIDMVILTHGHLDHVGYLPRLVKQGFSGLIYGTAPTLSIASIILEDSAKINEEEAERANEEGFSKHHPALPFYTVKEAQETIEKFREVPLDQWKRVDDYIRYRLVYNGHILGSTYIELQINDKTFIFSGDVGRENDPLLYDPKKPIKADYLFVESTYGDRLHPQDSFTEVLNGLIQDTLDDQGTLIIPSFAVERLQMLMYLLWDGQKRQAFPQIPIYVDSPMGNRVLSVFQRHPDWHRLSEKEFRAMFDFTHVVTSYKQTWEVIDEPGAKIIIAGSGMVTGGRVLTYLQQLIDRPNTRILLVGYQADGTRGRKLKEGADEIKIYGKYLPVRAEIHSIDSLSAHADQAGLLSWMSAIEPDPQRVFLIHGEVAAQEVLSSNIVERYGWEVVIPRLHDVIQLEV